MQNYVARIQDSESNKLICTLGTYKTEKLADQAISEYFKTHQDDSLYLEGIIITSNRST